MSLNEPIIEIKNGDIQNKQRLKYRHQLSRTDLKLENKNLKSENITDFKTGLLNERGFSREIIRQIEHAERTGESLTVVFIDADNFKKINSIYKYEGGDVVLKLIAKAMNEEFRSDDTKARWGGDEYVALMSREHGKKTPELESLSNRLNNNLKSNLPTNIDPDDVSVTLVKLEWNGESPSTMLKLVQDRLLEQKSKHV